MCVCVWGGGCNPAAHLHADLVVPGHALAHAGFDCVVLQEVLAQLGAFGRGHALVGTRADAAFVALPVAFAAHEASQRIAAFRAWVAHLGGRGVCGAVAVLERQDGAYSERKGYWVNIFNAIQNIGRTTQVKVCATGRAAWKRRRGY